MIIGGTGLFHRGLPIAPFRRADGWFMKNENSISVASQPEACLSGQHSAGTEALLNAVREHGSFGQYMPVLLVLKGSLQGQFLAWMSFFEDYLRLETEWEGSRNGVGKWTDNLLKGEPGTTKAAGTWAEQVWLEGATLNVYAGEGWGYQQWEIIPLVNLARVGVEDTQGI